MGLPKLRCPDPRFTLGVVASLLTTGQYDVVIGVLVGCLFVPTLAITLGLWTGTRRAFELVYLLLWYFGPVNGVTQLDVSGRSSGLATTAMFALATVLLAMSLGLRRRSWSRVL